MQALTGHAMPGKQSRNTLREYFRTDMEMRYSLSI
jgi:hypothetical protein